MQHGSTRKKTIGVCLMQSKEADLVADAFEIIAQLRLGPSQGVA
jgi:hypothetical protein